MYIDDIEIEDRNVLNVGRLNVVVRVRDGLLCLNRYSPIGRSILFYGEHGHNELAFCGQFLKKGDVVFDVGAHQGTHSLTFARTVEESGAVYSFEPQRIMFQNLCASVALNSLANVYAFNNAVGEDAGSVRIVSYDYAKRAHFSGMKISAENTGEEIPLIALDSFAQSRGLNQVNFLKIDVEGMELSVLLGAQKLVSSNRPIVYCEYHHVSGSNEAHAAKLREFFVSRDYAMFLHEPLGFNAQNYYGYAADRFKGGKDHNAICIHSSHLSQFEHLTVGLRRIT